MSSYRVVARAWGSQLTTLGEDGGRSGRRGPVTVEDVDVDRRDDVGDDDSD